MMTKSAPIFRILAVILIVASFAAAVEAAEPVFIKPSDVDWGSLLQGPPAPDSDVQKAEIAELLEWQNKRTAADIARCKSEVEVSPFIFSEVLGDKFTATSLPVTAELLKQVQGDIKIITKQVKAKWERRRPPAVDSRIHPCVAIEETGSYPSAHSVRGIVWARILSEIFPDKKEKLIARGQLMGEDRVIAGIHFPSDVAAGQKLGEAIATKLLQNPQFQKSLQQAKDECGKKGIAG